MHADRAAMDQASGMPLLDGIGDVPRALDVDVVIVAIGMLRLAVDGRDVIDDVAVFGRASNGGRVGEVAGYSHDTVALERRRFGRVADQRAYFVAAPLERSGEMTA